MTAPKRPSQHGMADLAMLRSMRNAVIGSRTRKSEIVAQGKVPGLVALLVSPSADDEVRSLAATIIGSLAHAATPPTLLSLCRAGASDAILASLDNLAQRMSKTLRLTITHDALADPLSTLSQELKLLESYLRALRAILMALADEVAPGTKWERGLSFGVKAIGRNGSPSPSFGSIGKSAREVVGWHMASAGFEEDGDTRMVGSTSFGNLRNTAGEHAGTSLSPHEELILLARRSIANAFHPSKVRLWLGSLFISRLPVATKVVAPSRPGSAAQSRPSTRPASPALAQHNVLSRSSSMSMGSDLTSVVSPSSSHNKSFRNVPTSSSQVRVLTIAEIVSSTLSSCLAVISDIDDFDGIAGQANAPITPADAIAARRKAVLDFRATDSPYWSKGATDDKASDERGRGTVSAAGECIEMQGSFVKRGKSIDGRGMNQQEQMDAVARQADDAIVSSQLVQADTSVVDVLLEAVECGYAKTQEAALWALTDLSRENADTSRNLFSCVTPSGAMPTSMLLGMRKDPSVPVRLAAFCCLAHIIKVHPFTPRTNECVLSVLVELMDVPGEVQITAIFALARLVADDGELQALASEQYECVDRLASLLSKSKAASSESSAVLANDHSAIDGLADRLREAALTALAALCFQRDEIRRKLVDLSNPSPLPLIVGSMSSSHVGIRIAACRLVRALSRSISILRTSLVDADVSARLLAILKDAKEDVQVRNEAIASICNLVLKFSPMKQVLVEGGGVPRLAELVKDPTSDGLMKLNALFAIKNILYSSESDLKRQVMDAIGWDTIRQMATTAVDVDLQEQALSVIRNVCSNRDEDIEYAVQGLGGGEELLDMLEEVIWQRRGDNTLAQAAFIVVNLATGRDEHRRMIIERPNLLDALVYFLNHPKADVRVAGIWAATNLTQPLRLPPHLKASQSMQDVTIEAIKRLRTFGFDKRLQDLVDDPERDVSDRARGLMTRFTQT